MNVSLTPELEKLVHAKVESGHYNNASEVMREALRLMHKRDTSTQSYDDWLRAEVAIAWEQAERGEGEPHDMQSIIDAALADD